MAIKWVDGRPVFPGKTLPGDEPPGNTEDSTVKPPARRPGPRNCKPYMRKRLARALPEIADALLKEARHGKLPELKMLMQLSGLDDKDPNPPSKRFGGRTFEDILLDGWRKENEDAAAANPIAEGDTHPEEPGEPAPGERELDQPALDDQGAGEQGTGQSENFG